MRISAVLLAVSLALTGAAYANVEENLAQLQQFSDGFALVASTATPGVVAIASQYHVDERQGQNPFEDFYQYRHQFGPPPPREGQGSGVIVNHRGKYYILTNYHVVRGADELEVKLEDGRDFAAQVVGTDSLSDVAVLKVDAQTLPAVLMGDSDNLKVGEWVLAIGNPFGFEHSVTTGIVSALGRDRRLQTRRDSKEYGSFIQTDAAINPGNSGGALVNLRGELVGINTAIITSSGGYQGIGFAIPVNLVKNVMGQLIEHGEVRRGLLGVEIKDLDRVTAEALGLDKTQGVLVDGVRPGGAADKAGVKQGDVVLEVDGKPVRNTVELKSQIGETPPGTRVDLLVVRGEQQQHLDVVLDQLTAEALSAANTNPADEGSGHADRLGLRVQALTPQIAEHLRYEGQSGVVVTGVQSRSPAARRGLQRGDLIQEVNRRPVGSAEEYERALGEVAKKSKSVLFTVRRGDTTNLVAVPFPAE